MPFDGPVDRAAIVARIEAHPLGETPGEMRERFARLVLGEDDAPPSPPEGLRLTRGAQGLVVAPAASENGPPLIWLHGGGYVFGSPETHLRIAYHLAARHGLTVHLPRYGLAPEAPWPAQLHGMLEMLPEGPFALAGDSAGGHLALNLALRREAVALVLCSPNTDRSGRSGTRNAMEGGDPMVDDAGDRRLAALTFGDRAAKDPEVSPLLGDLSRLPPLWIEAGRPETLLDDARMLHRAARASGVETSLHVTDGFLHMGQLWAPWWPPACASLDRIGAFVRDRLCRGRGVPPS
jgi:acetyl esterase/lipase